MVINFVVNLGLISYDDRLDRRNWCYDRIGPIGEKWDWFITDGCGYEFCFESEKDYTLFLLKWS